MKKTATVGLVLGLMAGGANASLFDRGNGMIYDDVQNITWLADWHYGQPANGMDWATAKTWADNLVYGGFEDWRLPSALNPDGSKCSSYGCSSSEMGYMFYVNWGATATHSYSTGTNKANLALFNNVQTGFQSSYYWTGTEVKPEGRDWACGFGTGDGFSYCGVKTDRLSAVAVRDGDVPEPGTMALLSLTLGMLGLASRRRPV
jgi:PEP-CTERM motif